jgi:tetratricopeptide (TPR) repeat protein
MPIRARSHILEELSISRFKDALPDGWVYRPKTPDYGIDGEVEIFDVSGSSTGLSFNVQLRATDDATRADRVRLELDELDYYRSLELPTAVVRYGSPKNSIFWAWGANIASRLKTNEGQKTATHRFNSGDLWSETTPTEIRRTLEVRRSLATFPPNRPVPLRIDLSAIPASNRYQIDRAIAGAIADSNGALARAANTPGMVEAFVRIEPSFLAVGIDTLTSVTFDLQDPTSNDYLASTFYALARIFQRQRLHRQAESLARLLVAREIAHHNEDLAVDVCLTLSSDLPALARLAIINGLHADGPWQAMIAMTIGMAPQSEESRREARELFFDATLVAAGSVGSGSKAAAHYSIGNAYRSEGDFSHAIFHYNRARHLRPAYLQTDYFVRELAGVLFMSGHFVAAKQFYQEAARLDPDYPALTFLLGDALLLSGAISEARQHFENARVHCTAQRMLREAELKIMVCDRMVAQFGAETLPRRKSEANQILGPDGAEGLEVLEHLLANVDVLHPLARYNLGITQARVGEHESALHHFLACAFIQPQDIDAWTNAAICVLNLRDEVLLLGILSTAIHHMGADAYDRFRSNIAANGMETDRLAIFDEIAMQLLEESENANDGGFTIRLLDGDEYHAMSVSQSI